MKCPYCETEEVQVKAGKTGAGSQRMQCNRCQRRYTPQPQEQGYPVEMRQQAVRMYVDGMNFRRIGRHLRVDHKTVMNWVQSHSKHLPDAPVPDETPIIEADELYTFVGGKKTKRTS